MSRPLVYLVAALITGILAGYAMPVPPAATSGILALILFLCLVSLRKQSPKAAFICILLAAAALGALTITRSLHTPPAGDHIIHHVGEGKQVIEGIIDDSPEGQPDRQTITLSVRRIIRGNEHLPVAGRVMLTTDPDLPAAYGDLVRVQTRLRTPRGFRNPGGFDYEKKLRGQGIRVQGRINAPSDFLLIRKDSGNPLRGYLEKVRGRLRVFIRENVQSPQQEIMQALLLGDRRQIPQEVRDHFMKTGTSHILAISGLHVGMVASFAMLLSMFLMKAFPSLLLRFNAASVANGAAVAPILIFALIAGLSIPVLRATIMIIVFLFAFLSRKERDLYNTLALAAFIILLIRPADLFDISFQLSFIAVASLIFASTLLPTVLQAGHPEGSIDKWFNAGTIGRYALQFLFVSLSAALGTAPLIAYYFNGLSTITLPANCIVIPLLGMAALPLGLLALITIPFSGILSSLMVKAAAFFVGLAVRSIQFLGSLPGSYLTISTPSMAEILLFYLLLVLTVIAIRRKAESPLFRPLGATVRPRIRLFAILALAVFFLGDFLFLSYGHRFRRTLQVAAIDVGQGSSTLIRLPKGHDILIDGGGSMWGDFDVGRYVIAPYLLRQRIKKLRAVVVTHPHPDHLQGLIYILETFPVSEVWTNGLPGDDDLYHRFIRLIQEKQITHRILDDQTKPMTIGGAVMKIVSPGPARFLSKAMQTAKFNPNDDSLVIKLTYSAASFLFTGDIGQAVEKRLVTSGADIGSDVLFVAHHGGSSSSTEPFLKAVRPRVAVISCGKGNVYRFPHRNVLERLSALAVKVYRTDDDGAVIFTTDGRTLSVRTVVGNPKPSPAYERDM